MLSATTLRTCILITIGVFMAFLLPRLSQDGMFMDGELYAAVAHNQANGYGTFWEPRFSQVGLAGLTTFNEHPPLVFGMQAAWFRVFGSAFWVERLYALLMSLITAWCMVLLWRALVPKERPEYRMGWWAVLLWIIIPTVHWCFHNNMIENTMGVFTTVAVLFTVYGMQGRWWTWGGMAAVAVFLASMTKGLPGSFPLAAPVLLFITLRQGTLSRAIMMTATMVAAVVVCYALMLQWPVAEANLSTYVDQRLLHRIASVPTVDNRLATLEMLFSNMIGPLVLSVLLIFFARRGPLHPAPGLGRTAMAMGMIGLSGVAPLMLTMVQKSFYMAAALPIVAIATALWSAPALVRVLEGWSPKSRSMQVVQVLAGVVISASLLVSLFLFGTTGRDKDLLHDVHQIGELLPPHAKAGLPGSMWNEWSLQTYLMRYHFISVDANNEGSTWYITAKGEVPLDTASYAQQHIDLRELDLWRRIQ